MRIVLRYFGGLVCVIIGSGCIMLNQKHKSFTLLTTAATDKKKHNHHDIIHFQYPNATAMLKNHELRKLDRVSSFPSNVLGSPCVEMKKRNDDNATKKEEHVKNPDTSSSNSENDDDYDRRSNLSFPLHMPNNSTSSWAADFWPRLVMMPSYPTSGSFFSRMLYSLSTGITTGSSYKSEKTLIFKWGDNENNVFFQKGGIVCEANLQLPHYGSVALTKTHRIAGKHIDLNKFNNFTASNTVQPISHIVRLIRNPGDNLIRNIARWASRDSRKSTQCKSIVMKNAAAYVLFHQSWENASKHIPTTMLRYEHITNLSFVHEKMNETIEFMGEEHRFDVNYTQVVNVPTYKHGTLFKEMCGVDMARELHEITKSVSHSMGYDFDPEEGVWNIPE